MRIDANKISSIEVVILRLCSLGHLTFFLLLLQRQSALDECFIALDIVKRTWTSAAREVHRAVY